MPLSFHRVFREIRELLPQDAIIVNEGANALDIGRTSLPNYLPRHRLDPGISHMGGNSSLLLSMVY